MTEVIKINGEWLPGPDGDLDYKSEKIKTEMESEAGTTLVLVTRTTKLSISGNWKLSGKWMSKFREFRDADTVTVSVYYPDPDQLSDYTCQFEITGEKHLTGARKQLADIGGLYEVGVNIEEL